MAFCGFEVGPEASRPTSVGQWFSLFEVEVEAGVEEAIGVAIPTPMGLLIGSLSTFVDSVELVSTQDSDER